MKLDELLSWLEKLLGKNYFNLVSKTRKNIAEYKKIFDSRKDHILHREKITKTITVTKRNRYFFPSLFSIPENLLSLIEKYIFSEKRFIQEEKIYSTPFGQAPGGIPYLAVISHSVSRRVLHQEIADELEKQIPQKRAI